MSWKRESEKIASRPESQQVAAELAAAAESAKTLAEYDALALEHTGRQARVKHAAIFQAIGGHWTLAANWSQRRDQTPPEPPAPDGLAEALDRHGVVDDGTWLLCPLEQSAASARVLALHDPTTNDRDKASQVAAAMTAVYIAANDQLSQRLAQEHRIARLETMLQIAQQWRQTQELSELLEKMAEASTELIGAERASIFLWDKPNGILVGRPALGVEGGELRIPDDQGVVGDVVQTGQMRRVDEHSPDQSDIDRTVDEQLSFQTRSLLCAPLRGVGGELFGAFELINKRQGNFTVDDEAALAELANHASIALQSTQQHEHLIRSREQVAEEAAGDVRLIGECAQVTALRSKVKRVANTDLAVLILGENGTGKEVVSRMIHYLSERRSEPFVAVNCAALPDTLLESELFGHERGAFTDARETRIGKFELAAEGTLFLDEIGDMSAGGQAKLLRVLEEKTVVRVGGTTPIHTNARVIAATNQDLTKLVGERRFREDLFFRLNVVTLDLPPLRERAEDVLILARHFLDEFSLTARRKPPKLTSSAEKRLLAHRWPGNVRELRNVMERLAFLSSEDKVNAEELALNLSPRTDPLERAGVEQLPLPDATRLFQVEYIQQAIERSSGNVAAAARDLGLHRSNLYRKMRQLGMDADEP